MRKSNSGITINCCFNIELTHDRKRQRQLNNKSTYFTSFCGESKKNEFFTLWVSGAENIVVFLLHPSRYCKTSIIIMVEPTFYKSGQDFFYVKTSDRNIHKTRGWNLCCFVPPSLLCTQWTLVRGDTRSILFLWMMYCRAVLFVWNSPKLRLFIDIRSCHCKMLW